MAPLLTAGHDDWGGQRVQNLQANRFCLNVRERYPAKFRQNLPGLAASVFSAAGLGMGGVSVCLDSAEVCEMVGYGSRHPNNDKIFTLENIQPNPGSKPWQFDCWHVPKTVLRRTSTDKSS